MPLPTEQFRAQARRAGRTLSWRLEAGIAVFLALLAAMLGLLLLPSSFWFGILALAIAGGIILHVIRRGFAGRHRDLRCPNCGVQGEIVKIQHSYQFHCRRCEQTADTGVSSHGGV